MDCESSRRRLTTVYSLRLPGVPLPHRLQSRRARRNVRTADVHEEKYSQVVMQYATATNANWRRRQTKKWRPEKSYAAYRLLHSMPVFADFPEEDSSSLRGTDFMSGKEEY